MEKHYDENLRKFIPNCNSKKGFMLNDKFISWKKNISPESMSKSQYIPPKEIIISCNNHAKENAKPINANNILILTHPFYINLANMHKLKTELMKKEVEDYSKKLINFLKSNPDRSKLGIVMLEHFYHYASTTSLLLENNFVDEVIFTYPHSGHLYNPDELNKFREKNICFTGGYEGGCLNTAISQMRKKTNEKNIWAIYDLVLKHPNDSWGSIKPQSIDTIPPSRTIPLENLIRVLKLKK